MSIQVFKVNKSYNSEKVLSNVTFNVQNGEIVGFLGPNGAGKSTMMKILTGYIPQSSGTVRICNLDNNDDNHQISKKIGYLSELNPLYLDMFVKEYLTFIANIYQVTQSNIDEIIKKTGLQEEQHKLISSLSKGYKQRVGLAQALLHDPEVLILDEPSTGLDPNQLAEIRTLIKELGKEKTVMLSTHIMQEVEAICDRVIIINKGQIVANKTIQELKNISAKKNNLITIEFDKNINKNKILSLNNVSELIQLNKNKYQVISDSKFDLRADLFQFAVDNNLTVLEIKMASEKLEDIFQNLTK